MFSTVHALCGSDTAQTLQHRLLDATCRHGIRPSDPEHMSIDSAAVCLPAGRRTFVLALGIGVGLGVQKIPPALPDEALRVLRQSREKGSFDRNDQTEEQALDRACL